MSTACRDWLGHEIASYRITAKLDIAAAIAECMPLPETSPTTTQRGDGSPPSQTQSN